MTFNAERVIILWLQKLFFHLNSIKTKFDIELYILLTYNDNNYNNYNIITLLMDSQ